MESEVMGSEVLGLDIRHEITEDQMEAIKKAIDERLVSGSVMCPFPS